MRTSRKLQHFSAGCLTEAACPITGFLPDTQPFIFEAETKTTEDFEVLQVEEKLRTLRSTCMRPRSARG